MEHDRNPISPTKMNSDQQELCRVLEDLHQWGMGPRTGECPRTTPTEMFKGALFAQTEHNRNPDWIAQAAHSLREILYPFLTGDRLRSPVSEEKWRSFQGFLRSPAGQGVRKLWDRLNGFAHHRHGEVAFTPGGLAELLAEFRKTMRHVQPVRTEPRGLDALVRDGPDTIPLGGRGE